MRVEPAVVNAVQQQFGQVVRLGRGVVWAIPKVTDNARFAVLAASRIDTLRLGPGKREAMEAATEETAAGMTRDIFISHASEDKDEIARPLAQALLGRGVSVWFDEYELTLGDRLRQKIEEGLKSSRFGVVIMSHNFFAKRWPQLELDGLFALETDSKRILPVWHGIGGEDLRRYAPILSERLAVSTAEGLEVVVRKILRALGRQ